jgi:putative MFS transporter
MNIKLKIPWPVVIIAAIGYFVDLFDTFLLPALRIRSLRDLGVPDSDSLTIYTHLLNWQLGGMVLGSLFLWGPVADRKGRRQILIASILVYALANLLTASVQTVWQYAAIRFIAGVGLGGELGAGITLVSEMMTRQYRGVGTMVVGFFGMLGVVAAAILASTSLHWRTDYVIGGIMGLGILALRLSIGESSLFEKNLETRKTAGYFRILLFLFRDAIGFKADGIRKWPNLPRYSACILVGAPTFFVTALVVVGAPEFGRAFGMTTLPAPNTALIWTYLSIAIGDIVCGLLSQLMNSRKYSLLVFHGITAFGICALFFYPPKTPPEFYWRCAIAGLGIGYWANMVTNAAEQFGTNVRATVAITVPNFVRFLLFPISAAFLFLRPIAGLVPAAAIVGLSCSVLAMISILVLKDGFSADLDYNENV